MRTSEDSGKENTFPAKRPVFYYITDRRRLQGKPLIPCIRRTLARGVDFIQIREKDLDDRALFELTRRVLAEARGTGCRILVNSRPDIALAAGAHGVHLPSAGIRVEDIRKWFPQQLLIGVSVHTIAEVRRACAQGADYLLLGHIFATESKAAYGPSLGLKHLKRVCSSVSVPILGLGGIKLELVDSVLQAGAAGVAGIGMFQDV